MARERGSKAVDAAAAAAGSKAPDQTPDGQAAHSSALALRLDALHTEIAAVTARNEELAAAVAERVSAEEAVIGNLDAKLRRNFEHMQALASAKRELASLQAAKETKVRFSVEELEKDVVFSKDRCAEFARMLEMRESALTAAVAFEEEYAKLAGQNTSDEALERLLQTEVMAARSMRRIHEILEGDKMGGGGSLRRHRGLLDACVEALVQLPDVEVRARGRRRHATTTWCAWRPKRALVLTPCIPRAAHPKRRLRCSRAANVSAAR
jgi:hypothetical protein